MPTRLLRILCIANSRLLWSPARVCTSWLRSPEAMFSAIRVTSCGEPQDVTRIAENIASGDLSQEVQTRAGDQSSLLFAMHKMRNSLVGIVSGVRGNAEGVSTASSEIAHGNSELSGRTEQQASALQQTAASMEELSSTVRQNADNARQGNQLALTA